MSGKAGAAHALPNRRALAQAGARLNVAGLAAEDQKPGKPFLEPGATVLFHGDSDLTIGCSRLAMAA